MSRRITLLIIAIFLTVGCAPKASYTPVTKERGVQLPRDLYAHHDFRTEWWYHTGHFQTSDGKWYGFELVFFRHRTEGLYRFGLLPVWKIANPIHFAHFAITDESGKTFDYGESVGVIKPYFGGSTLLQMALVETMVGEHDAALGHLDTLLAMPGVVSVPWLLLDPRWAPLYEHPHFQELTEKYC